MRCEEVQEAVLHRPMLDASGRFSVGTNRGSDLVVLPYLICDKRRHT